MLYRWTVKEIEGKLHFLWEHIERRPHPMEQWEDSLIGNTEIVLGDELMDELNDSGIYEEDIKFLRTMNKCRWYAALIRNALRNAKTL